jgi:hypothetical protein
MKCTWCRPAKQLWQLTISSLVHLQLPTKFPKVCECLEKDKEVLFTFYDFPAQHWQHLRTTNPIESTFATVRLRTHRTKGFWFTNCHTDDGFQTWPRSTKALAPSPGLRTNPKGSYWRPFRRWRRTNPTSRLTSQIMRMLLFPMAQALRQYPLSRDGRPVSLKPL